MKKVVVTFVEEQYYEPNIGLEVIENYNKDKKSWYGREVVIDTRENLLKMFKMFYSDPFDNKNPELSLREYRNYEYSMEHAKLSNVINNLEYVAYLNSNAYKTNLYNKFFNKVYGEPLDHYGAYYQRVVPYLAWDRLTLSLADYKTWLISKFATKSKLREVFTLDVKAYDIKELERRIKLTKKDIVETEKKQKNLPTKLENIKNNLTEFENRLKKLTEETKC
jgi:hypothetical protein